MSEIKNGFFKGRDDNGNLKFYEEHFPNVIKIIADYVHKLGLKAGIYIDGDDTICGYYYDNEGKNGYDVGLYNHEEKDLKLFFENYDIDFIKVDWCDGLRLELDEREQYTKISKIIDDIRHKKNKCIVYNICRW